MSWSLVKEAKKLIEQCKDEEKIIFTIANSEEELEKICLCALENETHAILKGYDF